jgi:aspartokinase-like uncharacterized kinase
MNETRSSGPIVVKVGGSLFDLPDLGFRLRSLLERMPYRHVVLVPGGGATADVVREFDERHALGDDVAHELALRAMTFNGYFLEALLPGVRVVERLSEHLRPGPWDGPVVVDIHAFACHEGRALRHLPPCWAVTSDTLAAWIAVGIRARELVLLKSTDPPAGTDWGAAARAGFVDYFFGEFIGDVSVRVINLRDWQP